MQQIEQKVRQFIVDNYFFGKDERGFSDDDSFLDKGVLDSMGILTLVSFIQQEYAIQIDDQELVPDNWDSVRRVAQFVHKKRNSSRLSEDSKCSLKSFSTDLPLDWRARSR
jgi:acyl carrier protein